MSESPKLAELVSVLNNAELDVERDRKRLDRALEVQRDARRAVAFHPDAPKTAGDVVVIRVSMARPGRDSWTFLVRPGGVVERIREVLT